jgi:hypothetical protein
MADYPTSIHPLNLGISATADHTLACIVAVELLFGSEYYKNLNATSISYSLSLKYNSGEFVFLFSVSFAFADTSSSASTQEHLYD